MATTSRPPSVSSLARIEPVHPSPTIATSLCASRWVIVASTLRIPLGSTLNAYGGQWVGFVVTRDPVAIVVAGARKSDHLPGHHVAITAVDRIGEEPLLHVRHQILKELLAVNPLKLN